MSCATRSPFSLDRKILRLILLALVLTGPLLLLSCGPGNPIFENGSHFGGGGGGGNGTGGGGGVGTNFVALISGGQQSASQSPTSSAALYDLTGNDISPTGSMVDGRAYFTLTLLEDGTVLVAGGNTAAAGTTAEIFSPKAHTFTQARGMNCAHSFHTATLLETGTVLVAGGSSSACAELYDPISGSWFVVGNTTAVRFAATATPLPSGLVLVTGGNNSSAGGTTTNSAEVFNPATALFTATGNMVAARAFHTATLLSGGTVLIAGGENGTQISSTAELYDLTSGTFTATGNMTMTRQGHTATPLPSGSVLIAGGQTSTGPTNSAELYNPTTGKFTATGSMAVARANGAAVLLSSGDVLIVGGNVANTEAEIYNPNTGQFSSAGNFSPAGLGVAAVSLQ
jgi:large repetitive protein